MKYIVSLVLTVLISLTSFTASAAPFYNGSFEISDQTIPGSGFTTIGGEASYEFATGWFNSGDINYWGTPSDPDTPAVPAADGTRFVELDETTGSGVFQTFDTVPGTTYNVNFYASGSPCTTDVQGIEVTAGSTSFEPIGLNGGPLLWNNFSVSFVATDYSTTLSFNAFIPASPTYCGPFLDNILITTQDCPAAPAIASAYLQKHGYKPTNTKAKKIIAQIANWMSPGAYFYGEIPCSERYKEIVEFVTQTLMDKK